MLRASTGSAPGRARAAHLGLCPVSNPAPAGRSSPWRSRTAAGGTAVPPRRGSRSSPPPFPAAPSGRTKLQAAIAALHDEAQSPEATDWPQIAARYDVLLRLDDNPVVAASHAVAISMVAGPRAGLELVQRLGTDPRVNAGRRFYVVRGHVLVRAGHPAAALEACAGAVTAGSGECTATPRLVSLTVTVPPSSPARSRMIASSWP